MSRKPDPLLEKRPRCLHCGKRLAPVILGDMAASRALGKDWREPKRIAGYGWSGRFCGVSHAAAWALEHTGGHEAPPIPHTQAMEELGRAVRRYWALLARERVRRERFKQEAAAERAETDRRFAEDERANGRRPAP